MLAAKEGLALINGTQVSTALALAGLFRAHYEQVNFFSGGGFLTTDLTLDANNGSLTITGLTSLPGANTSSMMLGVCKGGAGGTDPGNTVYALGGPNAAAPGATEWVSAHVAVTRSGRVDQSRGVAARTE